MEQNRRYTDIILTELSDDDRFAIDVRGLAVKSVLSGTPVDELALERENETNEHCALLRAGAKERLLKLAGIDPEEKPADTGEEGRQEESTDSPREAERTLSPEQKEEIRGKLRERFEAEENRALYADTGITWGKVEEAMGDEDLECAYRAEQLGHNPAIFMADNEGFWFGTRANETPPSTRNCVLDEKAAEPLRSRFPELKSAVKSAEDIGFDRLMTTGESDHIAKNTGSYYERNWSYYDTPEDIREAGDALNGCRDGNRLSVGQYDAYGRDSSGGWRGTRRVLYKKTA